MARITVRIDMGSLSHFLDRELPPGARPVCAEMDEGNVIIRYAADEADIDFDELRVYLDFSDWEGKTASVVSERLTSGTFDAHTVYMERAVDIANCIVYLSMGGPPVNQDKAAQMQKELREAFKEAKAVVVTIPGIGMKRIE